jgi:hypothetical protein
MTAVQEPQNRRGVATMLPCRYHRGMGLYGSLFVLACSGSGAGAIIRENITIGYFCAAIGT